MVNLSCFNLCHPVSVNILKKPEILKSKRKKKTYDESKHQATFFKWLELQYPLYAPYCFSIPNEAGRSYALANVLRANGLKSGIPDVFCAVPTSIAHGLFIEFKKKGQKPTYKQDFYLKAFEHLGYGAAVCYSVDEAIKTFKEYIGMAKGLQEI